VRPAVLGRALVTDVVTRWGLSAGDAEQIVGHVLDRVIEDLSLCRAQLETSDVALVIGVDTALARVIGAVERTRRNRGRF
jgi:hypothetical protein